MPAKCNDSLACAVEDPDFPLEARTEGIALRLEVKPRLQVEPESVGRAEIARKSQRGIGRDGARTMDDLVDPARRYRHVVGESVLRKRQRLQEIGEEHFSGMDRGHLGHLTCRHRPLPQ